MNQRLRNYRFINGIIGQGDPPLLIMILYQYHRDNADCEVTTRCSCANQFLDPVYHAVCISRSLITGPVAILYSR